MLRSLHKAWPIAFFALLLAAPALAGLLGLRSERIENRRLASPPEWSTGALLRADFYADLAAWFRDRLPLRAEGVVLDAWLDYRVLGDSPSPEVLIGRDGWLFTRGALRRPCEGDSPPDHTLAALRAMSRLLARDGRDVVVLLSPNKPAIHPARLSPIAERLGACAAAARLELRRLLREADDLRVVDLWTPLEEAVARDVQVFPALDSHWSDYGGIAQAMAVVEALSPGLGADAHWVETGPLTRKAELPHAFMRLAIMETVSGHRLERPGVTSSWESFRLVRRTERLSRRSRARSEGPPLLPGRTLVIHDSFMYRSFDALELFAEQVDGIHWGDVYDFPVAAARLMRASQRVVIQAVEDRRVHVLEPRNQAALLRAMARELL